MNSIKFELSEKFLKNLNYFFISIFVLDLIITIYRDYFINPGFILHTITKIFSIHSESSFHNWISSFVLAIASLLGFVAGSNVTKKGDKILGWCFYLFAFMTMGMATDEEAQIHETVGAIYHELTTSGTLNLKSGWWLTAYLPLIIGSVCFLFFMLVKLKKKYPQMFFLFAFGLILWISAVGVEFLDGRLKGYFSENWGPWRPPVRYLTEYCEVIGSYCFMLSMVKGIQIQNKNDE